MKLYKLHGTPTKFRSTLLAGIKVFEANISSTKPNRNAFSNLADLYLLQRQDSKAIALLIRGLQRFSNDESLVYRLGPIYNKYKRFSETVELTTAALSTAKYMRHSLLTQLKTAYEGLGDRINASRIEVEIKTLK